MEISSVSQFSPRPPEIIEQVGSASTTGTFGISAIGSLPATANKIHLYTKINFAEGIGNALMDLFQAPLKITISIISILKTLNYLPFIAIPVAAIATPILILSSALYLLIEFIRTFQNLALSVEFEKKENLTLVLNQLKQLDALTSDTKLYLMENQKALTDLIGLDNFEKLENDKDLSTEKIKAIITLKKVEKVYTMYVKGIGADPFLGEKQINPENKDDHQYFRYLQKRIGQFAANEFVKDAEHIETYTVEKLDVLDIDSLKAFNASATELLAMVNTQRKKVLKVHIYSILVLSLAVLTLISSFVFVGPILSAIATGISIGASLFALASGFANDAYINHTGSGFSARLMIPIDLAAKEGESNSHIWNTASTGVKVAFVISNVFFLGIPLIYDRIAKSKWLTKLRNGNETSLADGNNFESSNSTFKRENMTISKYEDLGIKVRQRTNSPTSIFATSEEMEAHQEDDDPDKLLRMTGMDL